MKKKKEANRTLRESSAYGFKYNNEKYAGLSLNFRRWSGKSIRGLGNQE
ncbi:hypothetical protein [Phocaeicola salanitronis]|nr:hypothetical protein [Phocaeicola salanitronis]